MNEPALLNPNRSPDFDPFLGKWRVHNKRLVKRFQGCTEWETFEATTEFFHLLDGLGNCDQMRHMDGHVIGCSVRFFNLQDRRWRIYWIGSNTGAMDPPVIGGFANGRGVFEGPDVFEGRLILMRFNWTNLHTGRPRWDQEFSDDGGKTWECNWIMEHEALVG